MKSLVELVREFCSLIVTLFRSLLVLLALVAALAGYLLYLAASWVAEYPVVLLAPPVVLLTGWTLRRYVFGRELLIDGDSAVIVRRAGGRLEPLYRGMYKLNIGDRVCEWFALIAEMEETNLEEVYTRDEKRVRLSGVYELYISDPIRFYLLGRKRSVDFARLNRRVLLAVVRDFDLDEIYNLPFEINQLIAQTINSQIRSRGLKVINYRLDEAVWPETNERWRRNRSRLPLQAGQYWIESGNPRRRLQ